MVQSTNSKQLGSQARRCRVEQAAGQVASRGDARAGQRARTGGAKKPRRDLRGQRLRIRQLRLTADLLGDRRKKIAKLVWQIYESLSLRDKRTSTTAGPLELACCLPIRGGNNRKRARVDRVWFSGKHPPTNSVALCRGLTGVSRRGTRRQSHLWIQVIDSDDAMTQ